MNQFAFMSSNRFTRSQTGLPLLLIIFLLLTGNVFATPTTSIDINGSFSSWNIGIVDVNLTAVDDVNYVQLLTYQLNNGYWNTIVNGNILSSIGSSSTASNSSGTLVSGWGESFKAAQNNNTKITFRLSENGNQCPDNSTVNIFIRDSNYAGQIICSKEYTCVDWRTLLSGTGGTRTDFNFDCVTELTVDNNYFLGYEIVGGTSPYTFEGTISSINTYTDGAVYKKSSGSWVIYDNAKDLRFRLWYATPSTTKSLTNIFNITTDGNNILKYYSKDRNNNSESTITNYIPIDNNPPTVGLTTTSGFTISSGLISGTGTIIGGTATDTGSDINTNSCEYTFDNGSSWLPAVWNTNHCEKTNYTILSTNTYQFNTRVKDNVDKLGIGTATTTYTGNIIVPTTTISGCTSGWHNTNQTITLSCNGNGYNCIDTNYSIDSGSYLKYSSPFVLSNDGNHKIDYFSSSDYPSQESTKISYCAVDKTAPTTSFNGTATDWNKSTISINLNCVDTNSGCVNTYYRINSLGSYTTYTGAFGVSDGNNKIDYYSTDNAGNSETPKTSYAAQDKVNPTTSGAITSGTLGNNSWYTTDVGYTITPTDATSGIKFTYYCIDTTNACTPTTTYTVALTLTTESATNYVRFYSGDNADNNQIVQSSGVIKIDKTAPIVATTTISGFSTSSTYINGTGNIYAIRSDATSGIANCYYRLNDTSAWILTNTDSNTTHCIKNSITITNGTTYHFAMKAIDNAGLSTEGNPYTTTFTGLTTPTSTTSVTITDLNQYARRFTITCTDLTVGCKTGKTFYQIDGGTILAGTSPIDYNKIFTVGQHSIKYWSTNNLDVNEADPITYFDITGIINVRVKDENTGLDLNGVTFTLNGIPTIINTSGTVDLNSLAATTTNYIGTFTKTGYGTRYYQFDGNKYSPNFDINFLMLLTSLGNNLDYKIYDNNAVNYLPNTYFEMKRVNLLNWSIGRIKTSATGTLSMFTNVFDQNYSQLIGDVNTYSMVDLSILYPKNEDTLVQISELWRINISGGLFTNYTDLNKTKHIYLIPNLITPYQLKVKDMNTSYFERSYDQQYYGNPGTATLQPYLVSTVSGILTTINVISATTNQPIQNITLRIYKNISGLGRTLVETIVTDSKGQGLTLLVLNSNYEFEAYNGGTFIKLFTITATSSTVFFVLSLGSEVITQPGNSGFSSKFTPGNIINLETIGSQGFSQTLYNFGDKNITIASTITQNGVNLSAPQNYSGLSDKTFTYTVAWVSIVKGTIIQKMVVTTSDGNVYVFDQNIQVIEGFGTGYDPIYGLQYGLRRDLVCSSDPLVPCYPLLVLAFLICVGVTIWATVQFGVYGGQSAGLIFLVGMILFTYLTWIPVWVTAGLVLIILAFIVNERR